MNSQALMLEKAALPRGLHTGPATRSVQPSRVASGPQSCASGGWCVPAGCPHEVGGGLQKQVDDTCPTWTNFEGIRGPSAISRHRGQTAHELRPRAKPSRQNTEQRGLRRGRGQGQRTEAQLGTQRKVQTERADGSQQREWVQGH